MTPLLRSFRAPGHRGRWRSLVLGALVFSALSLLAPLPACAQLVTGRFITSANSWEQFDTVGVSHKVVRAFQSAIVDIAQADFSLHANMQAALTSSDVISEDSDERLYSLFARMKNIGGVADVSLGRIPFFQGVGLGTVDGALVTARAPQTLGRFTLYGGASVPSDYGVHEYGTMKDKFVVGAQALVTPLSGLRGSLSYMNRRTPLPSYQAIRVDPQTLDAMAVFVVPGPAREQLMGIDGSYAWKQTTVYGRYDYDFEMSRTQRGQLGARYSVNPDLLVTLDAIRREPRISAGSFFSQFTLKGVTEVEAGADYFVLPGVRTFLRGAYVAYDGDKSFRYSAGIGRNDVQLIFRGNTGYAGELASISLQGAYPLFDNRVVPNAGLSYMSYRIESGAPRLNATSAVLGTTLRPVQAVSLDLQGQWMNNVVVKSDFRFVGRLHFWFSEHLNLFE
jgi:hypothetical protein